MLFAGEAVNRAAGSGLGQQVAKRLVGRYCFYRAAYHFCPCAAQAIGQQRARGGAVVLAYQVQAKQVVGGATGVEDTAVIAQALGETA